MNRIGKLKVFTLQNCNHGNIFQIAYARYFLYHLELIEFGNYLEYNSSLINFDKCDGPNKRDGRKIFQNLINVMFLIRL